MEKQETAQKSPELEQANAQVAELTEQLQRLQAEFENYLKRTEREVREHIRFGKQELLKQLLIVLEDFERIINAVKAADAESQSKTSSEGIRMVYREFSKILSDEGVHPIEALGKPFNPTLHEVLMTIVDKEKDDGTIVQEFQRGYMLHDKVLRCSKVQITKKEE